MFNLAMVVLGQLKFSGTGQSRLNEGNFHNIYIYIYIYGSPPPGTYLLPFCTVFTVFKASPGKGFEGRGYPIVL